MPLVLPTAVCMAFLGASPAPADSASPRPCGKPSADAPASEAGVGVGVEFKGVEGTLLDNVRALSSLHRLSTSSDTDAEMIARLVQRAPAEARAALRPFGFYEPRVETDLRREEDGWQAVVTIDPGTPVVLVGKEIEVTGPGDVTLSSGSPCTSGSCTPRGCT